MQIRIIVTSLLLTCGTFFTVSAQQQYTLLECIDIALENNRNIKQQELNASAGQNFVFGRSIGLDNTYQNTNSSQTSFGIGADITLFDGLRMKHNIDARKADMHASEADLDKMRDDIIISVSTAFMQVLLNRELLQIAETQLETTRADIARRTELVKSGRMAQGELYEQEAQLAREELNRVQAASNHKLALLDLAQIMELEEFDDFDVTAPPAESLISESTLLASEAVYESALQNRPIIRSMQYRIESSEKEKLIARSQLYPSLSFGANIGTGYYNMSGRDNDAFRSQLRNIANTRLEMDKTKLELRKQIEQAYYNAVGAKSRWDAAKKSVAASNEAYRFAEEKHESGRANTYELTLAKNNQTQALGEEAQAKYEYAFRLKILELLKD